MQTYDRPTPETDAFMLRIDDSEIDLGQVESQLKTLECQRDYAREALDRIARPIWWMQEDAKRDGCTINGAMAANLADSGNYLRGIAERALSPENS